MCDNISVPKLFDNKDVTGVLISPWPDPTKKQLKGRHSSFDAEVNAAAENWLDGKSFDFFFLWLAKVRVRSL